MTTRRQPKPDASHFHGSGQYVRQIIKCLEKVNALSGYHAYQIFDDWSQLVEVCLEALPTCAVQRKFRKMNFSIATLEKVTLKGSKIQL